MGTLKICALLGALMCFMLSTHAAKKPVTLVDVSLNNQKVDFPKPLVSPIKVSSMNRDQLKLNFKLKETDLTPRQVFARLTGPQKGDLVLPFAAKQGSYEIAIDLIKHVSDLEYVSGDYTVDILVGDDDIQPLQWSVGKVKISLPEKPGEKIRPLYTEPLLHKSDTTLEPLPEIVHQMRPPDKRASSFLATAFSVAVAAPIVIFFLNAVRQGFFNFGNLPKGVGALWSLSFLALLTSLLAAYSSFWLFLPMFATLKLVGPLALVTVIVGNRVLKDLAYQRAALGGEGDKVKKE